jgi:hypothetical protein
VAKAKWIAGIGALFLFGSFGVMASAGQPREALEAVAPDSIQEAAMPRATSGSGASLTDISRELSANEKRRRKETCTKTHIACSAQCRSKSKNSEKLRACYDTCTDVLQKCISDIGSRASYESSSPSSSSTTTPALL